MRNGEHYNDPTPTAAGMIRHETEAAAQSRLMSWASMIPILRWFHHIPNGGFRNGREAAHLKLMGVKAGVSDLFLPKPYGGFHGLYIEMKSETGGSIRDEQKAFIDAVRADGYAAFVCKGFDAAYDCVTAYIKEDKLVAARNAEKGVYTWRK